MFGLSCYARQFFLFKDFIFITCMCVSMYVSADAPGVQNCLIPLELELEMVVSYPMQILWI